MPNLTPIPLSEEEHERLTALKHKLGANSWREMLMKLCHAYEEGVATDNPEIKDYVKKLVDERLKEREEKPKEGSLSDLLGFEKQPEKEGEQTETDEEKLEKIVKKCVREELANHKFEVEIPPPPPAPQPETIKSKCPECEEDFTYTKDKKPKYCSECGEEFEWGEDEDEW